LNEDTQKMLHRQAALLSLTSGYI